MINILIVEDKAEKQKKIKEVIESVFNECADINIDASVDISTTKEIMEKKDIDIMILDLYLPVRFLDGPVCDGGITLINQIKRSKKYKYPTYVISLSQHPDQTEIFKKATGEIHKYIIYSERSYKWSEELSSILKSVLPTCEKKLPHRNNIYDVAVICALSEELEYVIKSLSSVHQVDNLPYDDFIYFEGIYETAYKRISVIATCSTQMGMVAAATLTTKLIYNFCPKYIVMTGIAAGVYGKVNMGDAIVAEYTWDYGAGKEIISDEGKNKHKNTIQQIHIDPTISSMVMQLKLDNCFAKSVKNDFKGKKPKNPFSISLGAVATGAAVIANPDIVKDIIDNQIRDLIAIEMEIYGVYYAAKWSIKPKPFFLAIKSVCDYADTEKNDDFHDYAAYTSVRVFEKLLKEYFQYD